MSFSTDNQTLNDLNLLGKHRRGSIYSLFCKVQTTGGERWLNELFQRPLTDADEVNRRSGLFRYFSDQAWAFPLPSGQAEAMENYLESPGHGNLFSSVWQTIRTKALAAIIHDETYAIRLEGLLATARALQTLHTFLKNVTGGPYADKVRQAMDILEDKRLAVIWEDPQPGRRPLRTLARYDFFLRTRFRPQLETVRHILNELDVYIAVGNLARINGWGYALALPAAGNVVRLKGLRHPALNGAVGNDLTLDKETNMLFLTGANMAGKSTFMKAFGVSLYLAHMGFPVAAAEMEFSIRDGLFSSINVADDINQGHSHFYAEVMRVKKVAQAVSEGKALVVLFDELFKGTNVKDAYDGTLAVTSGLARYKRCIFIISTHIVEVGEALGQQLDNLRFACLPTILQDGRPRYTYQLQEGIAADRVGMTIIENEGILDIIR